MSVPVDPLTNVLDAAIKLVQSDALLKQYPWSEWDSDAEKQMPRGYVNVEFAAATIEAGGPITAIIDVVFETKPKRDKGNSAMGQIFGLITDPSLHLKLNAYAAGKVQFYRQAENLSISQRINGDVRVRTSRFHIQILPLA